MRLLILLVSVWAITYARPETYRESEDFQYSRSSSDEGSKSGFYGAQRGNTGGNYERAHNMDGLAQHQMSTAVRQVEGELGEGAKEKSGSVFTAANSRGIYGSGHYDLSNLKGRNFDESGVSDSLSHSSLTSQNAGHRSFAYNSGYNTGFTKSSRHKTGYASGDYSSDHSTAYNQNKVVENTQQANNQYSYGNQAAEGSDYKYYARGGSRAADQYDANLHNAYDSYDRRVPGTPVRVVLRPGSIETISVAAQPFDASLKRASYDHNAINSEAEELSRGSSNIYVKPNAVYYTKPKHYESSYSYRKEWEKHNIQPAGSIPTENPFSKDSEIYDDSLLLHNSKNQFSAIDSNSAHTGSSNAAHSGEANYAHQSSVNTAQSDRYNTKSSSGHQSQHSYESQRQNAAAAHSDAYILRSHNAGAAIDENNLVENIESKPKNYQSSYSYHKSWERRGDPYVIKPVGGDSSSQKLIAGSANQDAYSLQNYGSLYNRAHQRLTQGVVDCDENDHIRVARSAYDHNYFQQQQSENMEDLGQRRQKLEDFGQQSQNLEEFGQQSQKLEDFGQQSQNLEDFGQQSQNLEDLGQQNQKLEYFGQQRQNLEDFRQQSQKLEDFGQQSQNLEDFGQKSQKLENFGHQSQYLEDFGQQSQNLEDFGQQEDLGQQVQNEWSKFQQFNEQSTSTPQRETQEQIIDAIPVFNQNQATDEQKLNSFWDELNINTQGISQNTNQTQDFDFQNGDKTQVQNQLKIQKQFTESMYNILGNHNYNEQNTNTELHDTSNSYENPFQYHHDINYNDGENQYTGFSQYSQHTSDNGMRSWQKQYQIHGNSNYNGPQEFSPPLQNFWSKLDNLDSQGGFKLNEQANKDMLYSQDQSQDWNLSNWEQKYNNMFNILSTPIEKASVYPQILKTTTTTSLTTESVPTTLIVRENAKPMDPIVVGRGDIDADTPVSNNNYKDSENDQKNLYIPKPNRHFKTPDEIESLSLTIFPKGITHRTTIFNKDNFDYPQSISTVSSTTVKTMEYEQFEKVYNKKSDKSFSYTPEETDNQKEIWSGDTQKNTGNIFTDVDKPFAHQPFNSQNSFDLEQQIQDSESLVEMQENIDQQFEDIGQQQDNFDLGQHSQNVWKQRDKIDNNEIQQLESFTNNDDLHNDEQVEQSGRSNDKHETRDLLHQNSNEEISLKKVEYQNQQHPHEIDQEQNVMLQTLPEKPDIPPTPEATEKKGFWKSVGSRLTSAKDTVVSWFKKN